MSDTSGLPNTDDEGVPKDNDPERFEETSGRDADRGGQAEPDPTTGTDASKGTDGAEPPPAEFDPAQKPSNPDLVDTSEAPD